MNIDLVNQRINRIRRKGKPDKNLNLPDRLSIFHYWIITESSIFYTSRTKNHRINTLP